MEERRICVDFNEMIEDDLVLLSQSDFKEDSNGNLIKLKEGLKIKIYSDDVDGNNMKDNLIAEGVVERNMFQKEFSWIKACKWNCRIDSNGIRNESEIK
jgi:hypothetical protein